MANNVSETTSEPWEPIDVDVGDAPPVGEAPPNTNSDSGGAPEAAPSNGRTNVHRQALLNQVDKIKRGHLDIVEWTDHLEKRIKGLPADYEFYKDDLEGRIINLRNTVEALQRRLINTEDSKREIEYELDAVRNELQIQSYKLNKLKQYSESLRHTVQRLRNIPTSDEDDPSRDLIIARFNGIKELVREVVDEDFTMQRPRLERYQDNIPLYNKQKQFFYLFHEGMSEEERRNRTRATIFDILWEEIFSKKTFGLNEDLESWMVYFERIFLDAITDEPLRSQIHSWRKQTIRLTTHLSTSSHFQSPLPQTLPITLQRFFSPIQLHTTPTALHAYQLRLQNICTQSYFLTLLLRGQRGIYSVEKIQEGVVYNRDIRERAERVGVEGREAMGGMVVYTQFGALIWRDEVADLAAAGDGKEEDGGGEGDVLVKAEVICRPNN